MHPQTLHGETFSWHMPAWIDAHDGVPPYECQIEDLSEHTAWLATDRARALPERFELLLTPCGSLTRPCRVLSRDSSAVIVEFT